MEELVETETWKFINTFAPWFSAIGTILAVVTSLYSAGQADGFIRRSVQDIEPLSVKVSLLRML